mmetsp:Transcript_14748/g.24572  ORF Transcript_14748/g.24572 Transcript_14748/m.24572 type:complete len:82 (-) Transcript_14748:1017-1262(-)
MFKGKFHIKLETTNMSISCNNTCLFMSKQAYRIYETMYTARTCTMRSTQYVYVCSRISHNASSSSSSMLIIDQFSCRSRGL